MFDPPLVSYMNEDLHVVSNPDFTLAEGNVERFHIWAYARVGPGGVDIGTASHR
jgi:hypothetical protein